MRCGILTDMTAQLLHPCGHSGLHVVTEAPELLALAVQPCPECQRAPKAPEEAAPEPNPATPEKPAKRAAKGGA